MVGLDGKLSVGSGWRTDVSDIIRASGIHEQSDSVDATLILYEKDYSTGNWTQYSTLARVRIPKKSRGYQVHSNDARPLNDFDSRKPEWEWTFVLGVAPGSEATPSLQYPLYYP